MELTLNPAAPHSLPWFITPPGSTDVLMNFTVVLVLLAVLLIGVLFFWLHSLPERMGHKKLQFEVVAVLGLLSLFTHQHAFWIVGLLLALIDLPDFLSPLRRIAASSEKIAETDRPVHAEPPRLFAGDPPNPATDFTRPRPRDDVEG